MRSAALTPLAIILSLGAGFAAPSKAQDTVGPRTSFQGEFDPVLALAMVYDATGSRNDVRTSRPGIVQSGSDFIEPLYDVAYVEGGIDKHAVIATLTPRPRSEYNCHACSPMLGGAVFRRDGDVWHIEARGLKIEPGHAWFDEQHGRLALVRVGTDRYGLLHLLDDISGGHETKRASLIFGVDGVLASRLIVPPVHGPGPGACGLPAQHLKVEILDPGLRAANSAIPPANGSADRATGFYEILVDALWNEARCGSVEGGTGAKSSGQACQRTSRYRYRDGYYERVDAEDDVCRQLPERTVEFRG